MGLSFLTGSVSLEAAQEALVLKSEYRERYEVKHSLAGKRKEFGRVWAVKGIVLFDNKI